VERSGSQHTATVSTVTSATSPPVDLRVVEHGDRTAPVHLLLLHGFPDDQRMWEPVVERLPQDWHVVTVDLRGFGGSGKPEARAAYRLERLVEDVVAVVEHSVPQGEQVHLVGHDWGSVLGWDVLAAETLGGPLAGRLASYTSISGPSLDHLASVASTWSGRKRLLPQMLHSWYVWLFQLPRVPELAWERWQGRIRKDGARLDPTIELLPWGPALAANTRHSVNLYRANVLQRSRRPRAWQSSVPVQLVVPSRDAWVTPRAVEGMEERCLDLSRVDLDAGHWVPRAQPGQLAALVADFVRRAG
jgi:pimeloyl-ACP methyl ester carboxylesterase